MINRGEGGVVVLHDFVKILDQYGETDLVTMRKTCRELGLDLTRPASERKIWWELAAFLKRIH